ncbi:hypothetical protein FQN54_003203 [Arachnomyces sp. PD_36]|nr:hypothetical protein FQN54_003203 [Arachnomyces sp. PD_36]
MYAPTKAMQMMYKGTPLEKLAVDAGVGYFTTVGSASGSIEQKYPRVSFAKIQGTKPHTSSRDKADTKKVVTVGYHTSDGTRLLSIHAHDDGTWNEFFSRAGRPEAAAAERSQGDSQSASKSEESKS